MLTTRFCVNSAAWGSELAHALDYLPVCYSYVFLQELDLVRELSVEILFTTLLYLGV